MTTEDADESISAYRPARNRSCRGTRRHEHHQRRASPPSAGAQRDGVRALALDYSDYPEDEWELAISVESRAYLKALGQRLARHRRAQGITQTELADILHVSQQTMFAYQAGERRVSLSLLPTLAKTLGCQ